MAKKRKVIRQRRRVEDYHPRTKNLIESAIREVMKAKPGLSRAAMLEEVCEAISNHLLQIGCQFYPGLDIAMGVITSEIEEELKATSQEFKGEEAEKAAA